MYDFMYLYKVYVGAERNILIISCVYFWVSDEIINTFVFWYLIIK